MLLAAARQPSPCHLPLPSLLSPAAGVAVGCSGGAVEEGEGKEPGRRREKKETKKRGKDRVS